MVRLQALIDTADFYLRLEGFERKQVLEKTFNTGLTPTAA